MSYLSYRRLGTTCNCLLFELYIPNGKRPYLHHIIDSRSLNSQQHELPQRFYGHILNLYRVRGLKCTLNHRDEFFIWVPNRTRRRFNVIECGKSTSEEKPNLHIFSSFKKRLY